MTPYLTVKDGVDHAGPGATVKMEAGTYHEVFPMVISKRLKLNSFIGTAIIK
jgi:hypothetical protein